MTDLPPLPPRDPPPSSGADNSGGKNGDKDDAHEWDKAVKDVRPLTPSNKGTILKGTAPPKVPPPSIRPPREAVLPTPRTASQTPPNPGIDRRTALRLREGRMEIDGRIDLHGMTLAQAHQAVVRFILQMVAAEKRCLLVITGKGQRDERVGAGDRAWYEQPRGQIRQTLPMWLGEPNIAPYILSTSPARPEHGGSGAIYVLLRRNRG